MKFPARTLPLLFALAAVIVSVGFAGYTGHMWEDYLITFRASLNFATGHGLVYQPGERVHSFTSPLGTLIPAMFALGGGGEVEIRALWGLRVISALALAGALWIAIRTFQRDGLASIAFVGAGAALVLDPKIVDFAVNGMETGLLVFFVTFSWHSFASGARLWPCAFGFAGLQWTRPDGCVFFGALAAAWILCGASAPNITWRTRALTVARAGLLGGVLYLPWFVFAWAYYGSPVPHTILAKAPLYSLGEVVGRLATYPWRLLFGQTSLHDSFLPTAYYLGGWPEALRWLSRIFVVGAALAWAWPRVPPAGRVASGAFFLGGLYLAYVPGFPWYFPGWQSIGLVAWAYLFHALWTVRPSISAALHLPRAVTRISITLLITVQAALLACAAWQMRVQQRLVENGHRREIGRWLAQHAGAKDTVFVECLGYLGFYSGLKMLDCPGLAAPEVVAARRDGNTTFAQLITTLRPQWVVLRPNEALTVYNEAPILQQMYRLVRSFDISSAVEPVTMLPGRGYLDYDAAFLVYRRVANDGLSPLP